MAHEANVPIILVDNKPEEVFTITNPYASLPEVKLFPVQPAKRYKGTNRQPKKKRRNRNFGKR